MTGESETKNMESKNLSNCALQIALQTMKDRCQQLQLRLSNLEEENLKLRIDKKKNECNEKEPRESSISKLNEDIEMLNQQKTQLTHHIFMVATENKELWTKLSMLTQETSVPEQSLSLVKDNNKSDNFREVDINIANNSDVLELTKSEVKDASSMKDFEFNLSMMSNVGEDSNNFEMMELGEELNQTNAQLRTILGQLKNHFKHTRTAVNHLNQMKKDKENEPSPLCLNCRSSKKDLRDKTYKVHKGEFTPLPTNLDLLSTESSLADTVRVCPICKHVEAEEEIFLEHVYSHFGESNEEDMSTGNTLEHAAVFPQFNV